MSFLFVGKKKYHVTYSLLIDNEIISIVYFDNKDRNIDGAYYSRDNYNLLIKILGV